MKTFAFKFRKRHTSNWGVVDWATFISKFIKVEPNVKT